MAEEAMNSLGQVRMIQLQFSFSNGKHVPTSVSERKQETQEESAERKARGNGVVFLEPTQMCALDKVLDDLVEQHYILVDAFTQTRFNPKAPKVPYYMVRFVFIHRDFYVADGKNGDFIMKRDEIIRDFALLCKSALWRVRGFNNPFFQNDTEVPGNRFISVNLEGRTPLFQPDGKPILVWDKDGQGNRLGNEPKPLKPLSNLRFRV